MNSGRAVVSVACLLTFATACSANVRTNPGAVPVDARGKTTLEIDAKGNQFTPAEVIVDPGTKITWRNTDSVAHNVEKSADALDFGAKFGADASLFGPGQTYSFTFVKTGTYFYTCTIHTLMSGKVQVVAKAKP